MSIGAIIKKYRKNAGLTQIQLGKKVFKSAQVISNWERGYTTGITADDIRNLSQALNIPSSMLIEDNRRSFRDDSPQGYYLDEETARIANEMKENPGRRVLFDATRNLSPEKIKQVKDFVDFITRED